MIDSYFDPSSGSRMFDVTLPPDAREPEVKLMGLRVVQADDLPEGIVMFVKKGRVIGIIDNRNDKP